MVKYKREHSFRNILSGGISYISQLAKVFPQIVDGTKKVMKNIDYGIIPIEKRILRKITYLFIIGFGLILLILALFSYLKEYLDWSNTAAYFSIGIIILIIGLLLKAMESDK